VKGRLATNPNEDLTQEDGRSNVSTSSDKDGSA
jgi:hypothetical protein